MGYLEMYGEKYGELKHILKRAHGFYLTRIQNLLLFPTKRKIKEWEKYEKESVCVPFEAETFKNKTLKRPNHTCIYTVVKVSSKTTKNKTFLWKTKVLSYTQRHMRAL